MHKDKTLHIQKDKNLDLRLLLSYRSGQEMSVLEHAQEVRDEEAAEHQAHGKQGGVWVGPLDLHLVDGHVAVGMHLLVLGDDGVEGICFRGVQMLVV